MVIYADVLLVTNFIISYFLLLASSVLSGYTYTRKRIIISAFTGAIFCLYIFVQSSNVIIDVAVKITSLMICSFAVCGLKSKRRLLIYTVCYVALNLLLTGIIVLLSLKNSNIYEKNLFYYFSINPVVLVVSSMGIYFFIIILEVIKEKISPQTMYKVDIYFEEFSIKGISAFYDSGFKVKDIIANKDVIIVSFEKIKEQLPEELKINLMKFLSGDYISVQERLIPVFFNTLTGSGMVPAVKAKYMTINKKEIENIVVAFTQNSLTDNVSAIFGTDIKKQL